MTVDLPDYMEVEIGSYCNRRCAWCPNGWSPRGRRRAQMAEEVWRALLSDLSAGGYRGWFGFHNYNEPLADPTIFSKIADVRREVSRARPVIYTNGRLLDRDLLHRLVVAGVREVRVTRYPAKRRIHAEPDSGALVEFLRTLGCDKGATLQDRERRVVAIARVGPTRLLVGAPRIQHYTSRAGSVGLDLLRPSTPRSWPCYYPVTSAAIDYHGQLKLCCHIYDTTQPESRPYLIGNVGEVPFSELWHSARLETLRERLARADFTGLPACVTCSHRMTPRQGHRVSSRRARVRRAPPVRG